MEHKTLLSIELDPFGALGEIEHSIECAAALCEVATDLAQPGDIKMLALLFAMSARIDEAMVQLKKAKEPLNPCALARLQNAVASVVQGAPQGT